MEKQQENRGLAQRDKDAKETLRSTKGSYKTKAKAAVRSYCGCNVWAQENAKAVGNW